MEKFKELSKSGLSLTKQMWRNETCCFLFNISSSTEVFKTILLKTCMNCSNCSTPCHIFRHCQIVLNIETPTCLNTLPYKLTPCPINYITPCHLYNYIFCISVIYYCTLLSLSAWEGERLADFMCSHTVFFQARDTIGHRGRGWHSETWESAPPLPSHCFYSTTCHQPSCSLLF